MESRRTIACFLSISRALVAEDPLEVALQAILEAVALVLPRSRSRLMLLEDDTLVTIASVGLSDDVRALRRRVGEGLEGRVVEAGEPLAEGPCLTVPLKLGKRVLGVLQLHRETFGYDVDEIELGVLIANLITAGLERHRLGQLATTDALTGVGNRRHHDTVLSREISRSQRHGHPLSLLLFDLDGLKKLNDTRGHAAGDAMLRAVARTVRQVVRHPDHVSRLGGDEFAVVLPDTPIEGARHLARRLFEALHALRVAELRPSVSIGLAELSIDPVEGADALIARADAALYDVKDRGGDGFMG